MSGATPICFAQSIRRAFSLIELLVVISIIALLISLLLPSLSSVRDMANIAQCASNQAQLGIAQHAHATDNDEQFAPSSYGVGSPYNFSGVGTSWIRGGFSNPYGSKGVWIGIGELFEEGYLEGGHMLFDPAADNVVKYDSPSVGFRGGTPWQSGNRWMNTNYIQRSTVGAPDNRVRNNRNDKTVGTGRQVSREFDSAGVAFIVCRTDFGFSPSGSGLSNVDWTHKTGYNVLYVDGAVDYVKLKGVEGQTPDPSIAGSENLTIAQYIKAMGVNSFKYQPLRLEKKFYYKLDRDNPTEAPAP